MTDARDPRWILLIENGAYVTIGRHREPEEDDIARAEQALVGTGLAGWVAVMSQSAYAAGGPEVIEVRPLAGPKSAFSEARDRLLARLTAERDAW